MLLETYLAPASWAPALINDDYSGLSDEEVKAVEAFIELIGNSYFTVDADLDDNSVNFCYWHDANSVYPYAADCIEYTVYKVEDTGVCRG